MSGLFRTLATFSSFSFIIIRSWVPGCFDTTVMILSDWHNTGAGLSENFTNFRELSGIYRHTIAERAPAKAYKSEIQK